MTLLLLLLLAVALFQKERARAFVCVTFACFTLIHDVIFRDVDGLAYYASAGAFDLLIIYLISLERGCKELVTRLQVLCLLSIVLNFIGWAMWVSYLSPKFYTSAYFVFYSVAIICMLQRGGAYDLGYYRMGCGNFSIRRNSDTCSCTDGQDECKQ